MPEEAAEQTVDAFVVWRRAAGLVCRELVTFIPLFNLSERTLVSLISTFLWKCVTITPCSPKSHFEELRLMDKKQEEFNT